jgi:hypothetical protein
MGDLLRTEIFALSPCQREVLYVAEPWRVFELLVAGFEPIFRYALVPLGQRDSQLSAGEM